MSNILKTEWISGLDLGQSADYTAFLPVRRTWEVEAPAQVTCKAAGEMELPTKPTAKHLPPAKLAIMRIERFDLGTHYPVIVDRIVEAHSKPPLKGGALVIDATGVGRPVVDMFTRAKSVGVDCKRCDGTGVETWTQVVQGKDENKECPYCSGKGKVKLWADVVPVNITAGGQVKFEEGPGWGWKVPKRDLVGVLRMILDSGRLEIANSKLRPLLRKELENFKVKLTQAGNDSYECLVTGTMVETSEGEKPIECVKRDDYVLTRFGYNRVAWSGMTKVVDVICEVSFSNGRTMRGTPDHLVWAENRNWVEMRNLTCQDSLILAPTTGARIPEPRSLSSMDLSIDDLRPALTTSTSTQDTPCTGPSGSSITARSRKGMTSTTGIGIPTTTTYRTSNASLMLNMRGFTSAGCLRGRNVPNVERCSIAVGCGVRITETPDSGSVPSDAPCSVDPPETLSVPSAAMSSRPPGTAGMVKSSSTAPLPAMERQATRTGDCPRSNVHGASRIFPRSNEHRNTVRVLAPPSIVRLGRSIPVYDLVVEGNHEFFANGVLVHNSWRERDHDDMVLAAALALWWAERNNKTFWMR